MGKTVFIDANIFLTVFLDDEKAEECGAFLSSLQRQGTKAVTTDFILYSCIIAVQRNLKDTKFVKDVIVFFNSITNLAILRPSMKDFYGAVEVMGESRLDFDDALVVACIRNYGIPELVSLDKDFDRVKDITVHNL